jgi:hypothetical protein
MWEVKIDAGGLGRAAINLNERRARCSSTHGAENVLLKFIVNNDDDDDEVTASLSTPARTGIYWRFPYKYTNARIASARIIIYIYRGYDFEAKRVP